MAQQSTGPTDERTPLLAHENGDGSGHEDTSFARQVKTWRRRRWISLITSAFLIVAFVVILILSGVLSRSRNGKPKMNSSICLTPACVHAASEILYNLSPDYQTLDPCTNFDALVCDGFNDRHDIPPDLSRYSTATIMSETSQTILRHILESAYPSTSEHSSFSPRNLVRIAASTDEENFLKMQETYNACINETILEQIGVTPLVTLIKQVAESFPTGNDSVQEVDYDSLSKTIVLLEQLQVSTFVGLTVGPDDKDPETEIIQAWPAGLTLPSPEYYTDDDTISQFQSLLDEVFQSLLPSNGSKAASAQLAEAVVELEQRIAKLQPPPEDQADVTKYYNIVKVDDVGEIGPAVGLDSVVKSLVPSNYTAKTMLLTFPGFLGNVSNIISETSKTTIQSYLIWHLINSYSSFVEGPEVKPILRFQNILAGRDDRLRDLTWDIFVSQIEAAFSEEAKQYGDQIIMDIKAQFTARLTGLEWMDDSVKKLATNKVNNIDQKIGYPTTSPDIMNPEALKGYYNTLEITKSFFNNSLSASSWASERTWSQLGKPVDHGEWFMQADVVNAYYNPVGNEIVFPAGIMQFPVFSNELPGFVNYGAFASVAGHELSHAFDSSGRHYDERGNYTDWWTNSTVDEFEKRAQCFVDQYTNYTIPGKNGEPLHVNGRLTLGENIADAGGINAAFRAYQETVAERPDTSLPGLDYFTHDQLFFVFYANWWCGKVRKEQSIQYIYTDPHSPAFVRILGTTANSRAFKESFNCPAKEPTCELW